MLGAGGFFNAVGVVQQYAEIANAPDAGFRAHRWLAGFDTRVAENALLGFSALPVEVDFFVRAAADTHAPTAALVLVNQHNAVFLTLVDGAARAGGDAARVEAVFAQARQVHHEGVFELTVHLLLHRLEVAIAGALFELAAEQLFPVRTPLNFIHPLAANQRARAGGGQVFALRRIVQVLIVVGKRLVVVVDPRQRGVSEDFCQHADAPAETRGQLTADAAHPAALPLLLVLPVFRVADAGFGLHVVKPRVFHPFATGPDVFTGDRAGVATDAFVEI